MKIKKGDVLFSKEYQCKITVEALTNDAEIVGVWHDEIGQPHREIFNIEAIKIVCQ